MQFAFEFMNPCTSVGILIGVISIFYIAYHVIAGLATMLEEKQAAAFKAAEEKKESDFQKNHPEAWRHRELLKLEKERMAAEKEAAERRAKQDAIHRGVGLAAGMGQALGWW